MRGTDLQVALYARAWIEMARGTVAMALDLVALYARAWIEMSIKDHAYILWRVALYARAWVEILHRKGNRR